MSGQILIRFFKPRPQPRQVAAIHQIHSAQGYHYAYTYGRRNFFAQPKPAQKDGHDGIDVGVQRGNGSAKMLQGIEVKGKRQRRTEKQQVNKCSPALEAMVDVVGFVEQQAEHKAAQSPGGNL